MVVNGTALEDLSLQRRAFRTENMTKTTPGNITAVLMVIFFHSEPLKFCEGMQ
jgi:hypothetical protein